MQFRTRRIHLDNIIQNMDVPVYELSFKDYKKFLKEKDYYMPNDGYLFSDKIYIAGEYCRQNEYIFIYKHMCNSAKLWVALHEYGHRLCYKNRCNCITYKSPFWREYHATKYAFEECCNGNFQAATWDYICQAVACCKKDKNSIYSKIYRRIMKSKLWDRISNQWDWE